MQASNIQEPPNLNLNQNKETNCEYFLRNGYIESFVDYFYISSRKTPNLRSKYERDYNIILESQSSRSLSKNFEPVYLRDIKEHLLKAENSLRQNNIEAAINSYKALMYIIRCLDILGPIYFVQKYINLAKKHDIHKLVIDSFIDMGYRFEHEELPKEDGIISMNFKEEAKRLYHLYYSNEESKDQELEKRIYDSLDVLYKDLAQKAEDQNNFPKAVEYLNKRLENLKPLKNIAKLNNEDSKENEHLTAQIESYQKIADMNFKMKDYDHTLECIEILQELLPHIQNNVLYYLF